MTSVRICTFAARAFQDGVRVWRAGSPFRGIGRTLSEALENLSEQERNSPPLAPPSRPTSSAEVVPPDPLAGRPAEQNISSKGTVSAGSFPEGDA